jgi:hypothetical protein
MDDPGPKPKLVLERVDLAEPHLGLLEQAGEEAAADDRRRKFKQQGMIKWLEPTVLLAAAKEVAASKLFAEFADKREFEGGLPARWFDCSKLDGDGIWVDYVSDTGDGFEPTFAIASLAGHEVPFEGENLPRGRILVLGGDQVYPSAKWEAYQDRFVGPYAAALPHAGEERRPYMFALPGNHDWYDGLTSFMRVFCQRKWIGGWKTEQSRSYFAIKLPGRWWLWAVDTQFDAYIDHPQLSYFEAIADECVQNGDKVILVTAKPSWVRFDDVPEISQPWRTLAFVEKRLIRKAGATLALTLTGDLHHYCRYEADHDAYHHKVTAGGGGAYLSATHPMPPRLELPDQERLEDPSGGAVHGWSRAETYPPAPESLEMAERVNEPPIRRHTKTFALLTGAIYALFALLVALALKDQAPDLSTPIADGVSLENVAKLVGDSIGVWMLLFGVLLWRGLAAYADVVGPDPRWRKRLYGLRHLLRHVIPVWVFTLVVLAAFTYPDWFLHRTDGLSWLGDGFWPGWIAGVLALGLGYLYGPWAFSLYLLWAHRRNNRQHVNELFAAQSQGAGRGYKQFLRIRIDPRGEATVYVIGVRDVPSFIPVAAGGRARRTSPWFEPADGKALEEKAELVEKFVAR